ncbi:L-serine ammonia-lyase, iron-sulfur-dependent, subunit alpha [Anaeromicropila populeti]|uniref:L-serine dehydratase n=1 Tax=Anaeromicropila populeti TaxID=37658 RepID=A0A1I6KRI4_9FIRM|nr:L-serine ammonia-lyase, iron-sulfur-dependent, subunit alpha [Anaeromicropila populeti]SFR93816.1 L-serine dehydratase [Anaeromicropila populeti]
MELGSLDVILKKAEEQNKQFWEIILEHDCRERQTSREDSFSTMLTMYEAMKNADNSYDKNRRSSSLLVGGDGAKLHDYIARGSCVSGTFMGEVMERAIKMGESNACMRRIVAAPTAGSCGVLPAVLITCQKHFQLSDQKIAEALYVASGIGMVIAGRASISGAEGGCQAEIGSASAMAAGAVAYLKGGSSYMSAHACAIALKNLLGLTCDPVAGLVEIPCIKRNVIGAVNAISSADLALAGIESRIPPDEVIDAMGEIGRIMPKELKETGKGGLAVTPTGKKITDKLHKL